MKIYDVISLEDGIFETAKKFLTVELSFDSKTENRNKIIKSFKVFSAERFLLFDDFLESEGTFYQISNNQKWYFDYKGENIAVGAIVIMEIKFYEDKHFSKICFIKTGEKQQDWQKGFVYDAVDDALIKLEGYNILRQHWILNK